MYEIMKWNISEIKHHTYEVLNMYVYLIFWVLTHGNLKFWQIFWKEKLIFISEMPFFLLLPPENESLQLFWTINAHNNEQFTIKHWEKILCEVHVRLFWSFLHQHQLAQNHKKTLNCTLVPRPQKNPQNSIFSSFCDFRG